MNTKFSEIYGIFFNSIVKDEDFFTYAGLTDDEAMNLATERAKSLLMSAIARVMNSCVPDVDFYDYNLESEEFNFKCTDIEKNLFAEIMRERLLRQEEMKLKPMHGYFNTKDLKIFSPAKERETFASMLNSTFTRNETEISNYIAKDRITGNYKILKFDHEE